MSAEAQTVAPATAPPRRTLGLVICAVAAVITIVIPLVQPMPAYALNMLMQASTYAIAVFGLTIVLGYTGQINLAQAAFFGLGAYSVALGTTTLGMSFWTSLLMGVVLAGAAGVALGATTLKLGGHYLAMVTISFQTLVSLVLNNWIPVTKGPDGISGIKRPVVFDYVVSSNGVYLAACIAALWAVGFFVWRLGHTRLGRQMQAVRDNELAASVVGVNTYRTKTVAFMLSSLLGGFGGGLFASGFAYISPDQFSFAESVVFLTMALLGGVRTPFGTALGTALLILLPEWLRFLKVIYLAVYGLAVILIMVFMPEGIWGFISSGVRKMRGARATAVAQAAPLALATAKPSGDESILLSVQKISKHFGGLKAVDEVDLQIRRNHVHALIGPNGSGKSTLLNVISGLYVPTGGAIALDGEAVQAMAPHDRAARGLGRTFQNIRLFTAMTVLDNVIVGAERPGNPVQGERAVRELALSALDFVGLADRADAQVGSLPYGHQRRVEIARALAGNPKLLLLDEPGAGLNHVEKDELVVLLKRLKGHGLTILIIDHDMNLVEQVAEHITVLNFGKRIADGAPADVLRHPDVIAAYLGEVRKSAAA